jgi:hypothetical protein
MSTQAEVSPSPSPSSTSSTSVTAVDFLNLVTQEYEPASSFFALPRTLDNLSDENDTPPFIRRKPALTAHLSGGVRAVTIFPENIQELFDLPEGANISNELILYEYDQGRTFWVLNAGSLKIIVRGNGGGFQAWLGPEEEFSGLRVAHPRKIKKTVEGSDGETKDDDEEDLSEEEKTVEGGDRGTEDGDDEDLSLELNDENTTLENNKASTVQAALLLDGQAQPEVPPSATPHTKSQQSTTQTPIIADTTTPIRNIRTKELKPVSYFYKLAATLAGSEHYQKLDCMTTKSPTLRRHPNGFIKVGLFEDEIKRRFGVSKDQVSSELTLYQYGSRYAFWTMRVGNRTVIVKGNGRTFRAWLGPGEGYSAAVTTSDKSGTSKAFRISDSTQLDPESEEADCGQDNSDDEEDVEQANLDGTTLNPDVLDSESEDEKPLAKTLKRPITFGEAAIARKRAKIFKATNSSGPRLSNDKLNGTHLYVSVSTNDYGPVPVRLRSCQKIGAFFSMVLRAWDLEEREAEIEAITVSFGWKSDEKTFVVKKNVPDSFDTMLKVINEAPCWDEVGDVNCNVDVRIIMV